MNGIGTTVTLTRGADGRLIYRVREAENQKMGDVAKVNGNVDFQIGVTSDGATQFMFNGFDKDTESEIKFQNTSGYNYNIEGENVTMTSDGGNAIRAINLNTTGSTLDLSNAGGTQWVVGAKDSTNNMIKLGYGNDSYIDSGTYNSVVDQGGSNRFETTEESRGSFIKAGAGDDIIELFGDYAIVDAGAGTNTIMTGLWGDENTNAEEFDDAGISNTADKTAGYRNIIISGSGNDTIKDAGGFNLFFDEGGTNTFISEGTNAIAYIGDDGTGEGVYNSSSDRSFIFRTETLTSKTGKTYNLYEQMKKYDWGSLYNYLVAYSTISPSDLRSFYTHGNVDNETLEKLEAFFGENVGTLEEALAEDKKLHPQKYRNTQNTETT